MAGIRRKLGTSPASKKAPVGDGELAALVATLGEDLSGQRDRALLTLGWSSPCRRSELVALDVADVEEQQRAPASCPRPRRAEVSEPDEDLRATTPPRPQLAR